MIIMPKQKASLLLIMIACSLFLPACVHTQGYNATTGALIGGITGAWLTSGQNNPNATFLGTLAGALIGSEIGSHIDEQDRQYAHAAFYKAGRAKVGKVVIWNNPYNGHHGQVVVIRDKRTPYGLYCREFRTKVIIDGRAHTMYGTACRRPDGTWKILK